VNPVDREEQLGSPPWLWFEAEEMNLYGPETGRNLLLAEG
jgi:hypothetical protein